MKLRVALFVFLVAFDVGTKLAALAWIPPLGSKLLGYPFGGVPLFEGGGVSLSLNRVGNTGAAWGLFQGHPGLLFGLRLAIIGLLLVYLFRRSDRKGTTALWMIAAGAVGNAIDYWAYGYVIDFIHFCFWGYTFPLFNVADSCITLGAFALLWPQQRQKAVV